MGKIKKGRSLEKMANKHVAKLKKKRKNLAEITTDEFMNQDFENLDLSDFADALEEKQTLVKQKKQRIAKKNEEVPDEEEEEEEVSAEEEEDVSFDEEEEVAEMEVQAPVGDQKQKLVKKKKKLTRHQIERAIESGLAHSHLLKNGKQKSDGTDSDSGAENNLDPSKHKKDLMNLKDTDPEFFKYLKTHDTKLLDFNVDDEDLGLGLSDDEDDLKHIPDNDLEIGSDDSDYEADDGQKAVSKGGPIKVTSKLLKTWEEELQKDKTSKTIKSVVEAFHAALEMVNDSETRSTQYRVEGGTMFNGICQLCMLQLPNAFKKFLKISDESQIQAHKAKRFPKIKGVLKSYLTDLIQVVENVSSTDIVVTLLKHLHQILPYTQSFSSLRKPLLRIILRHWSSGEEETVRVVAFLCLVKIACSQTTILHGLMKTMYIKYVENAKFVSPSTLPGINFMRLSLAEVYLLDDEAAYQNGFLYVRQLAIHLRNALKLKKKEHFQMVYNWQYINSLWFWTELIGMSKPQSLLRNLVYPLVQITIGVIKLIPTSQYFPLRFHCVRMLIFMSREANVFIPSLPFLLQVIDEYDFNKRHKAVSMKPLSLMCMLRVSKSQSRENAYKDALIDNVYELILESAAKDSYCMYFPDMYVPCVIKLKEFLKKCNVANYCRKLKQLLEKINESREFLETERDKRTFDLLDMRAIESWEAGIKAKGTPARKFYDSWIKLHRSQQLKCLTRNDEEADPRLPSVKRSKKPGGRKRRDSDEDSDLEVPVEEMERRLKKAADAKKPKKKKNDAKRPRKTLEADGENGDIVKDIRSSDWD